MKALPLLFLAAFLPGSAWAQSRPGEDDLFGGDAAKPAETKPGDAKPAEQKPAEGPTAPEGRDDRLLGDPGKATELSRTAAPEDPLKIGGQFYLRASSSARKDQPPSQWALSAPALVDGYFDARPNPRLRGMMVARLSYDPTVDPNQKTLLGPAPSGGPSVALDQLWLRFDVAHTVFVTAGKQHTRWGTGRFWQPTDWLHFVKKDPLAVFDARTGTTMVKAHLPVESLGWNFYGVGLVEGLDYGNTVGKVAGAARAELVFGPSELGLDFLAEKDKPARLGVDASAGIGDFDVYVDLGLRDRAEVLLWRERANPDPTKGFLGQYEQYRPDGQLMDFMPQALAGLTWSMKYNDNDVFTVGAEYFYNSLGYDDPKVYPWLLFQNQYTPFYTGKQYAALFLLLPAPGDWNYTSFTLSTLGNLSDKSFVTRLDYSVLILTHLTFEAYGAVHYGTDGGELRLGLDIPPGQVNGVPTPAFKLAPPLFDVGVALRVKI